MYNSLYQLSPQASIDRINNQIAELEKMKGQIPQQPMQHPSINQTFQLAPSNNSVMKYAGSIEEVEKAVIVGETPFFSNDMSVLWIKNPKGEIKTFEMKEIVPLDSKDIKIQYLEAQIEELKKGMLNNESNANVNEQVTDANESTKSSTVSTVRATKGKSK